MNPAWNRQEKTSKDITSNPLLPRQLASEPETKPIVQPPLKNNQVQKPIQAEAAQEAIPEDAAPEPQDNPDKDTTTKQIENPAQDPSEASTSIEQGGEITDTVDERGLYQIHQGKQTGSLLELAGWMWDTAPQPQDNTDESGKIVFQITIDELGEVIAVKTLEKTISPLVERIYKEALTGLTFSKTANHLVYAPTATGKVTFIIQAK